MSTLLSIDNLHVEVDGKKILNGLTLAVRSGRGVDRDTLDGARDTDRQGL